MNMTLRMAIDLYNDLKRQKRISKFDNINICYFR